MGLVESAIGVFDIVLVFSVFSVSSVSSVCPVCVQCGCSVQCQSNASPVPVQ